MLVPLRFARLIVPSISFVQYIFPLDTSNARPLKPNDPVDTSVSMFVPLRFAHLIVLFPQSVQYIFPLDTSNARPHGLSNPVDMSVSMFVPLRFARLIVFFLISVQYIFPLDISNARPAEEPNLVDMSVSMFVPLRFARLIVPLPSAQYIFSLDTSNARSYRLSETSNVMWRRPDLANTSVSMFVPLRFAHLILPVSVQYIFPLDTSNAMPCGLRNPVTRSCTRVPSKFAR